MRKTGKDNRPHLKPVTRIELSEERKTLRIVLAVVFLAIGIVAILVGLVSLLNTEPGWQYILFDLSRAKWGGQLCRRIRSDVRFLGYRSLRYDGE